MSTVGVILSAFILDFLIGDPRHFPHPVKLIGKTARTLERFFRKWVSFPFLSGFFTAVAVYALSFWIPKGLIFLAQRYSPILSDCVSVVLIWTCIAFRDLIDHSYAVYRELKSGNLTQARIRVGMMVGRDTKHLSESEVIRAAVESVAESMIDGVVAPLFFAILGGAPWAMLYKAINTLDSLFGHRDEKYSEFGKTAARVDDLANWIPARVTSPLVSFSAALLGYRFQESLKILVRDGRKHASPNAGLSEAAFAGALGVRLGGVNTYDGIPLEKPFIGDPVSELNHDDILRANSLLTMTCFMALGLGLVLKEVFS
jgi:adenosylcobinamide-phosphate synthase